MTVKERATTIAYADMLAVCELMQHISRVGWDFLPADLKASLVKAESCLDDAKSKFSEFMRGQTDFVDGAV
jgi:hypothetical protein